MDDRRRSDPVCAPPPRCCRRRRGPPDPAPRPPRCLHPPRPPARPQASGPWSGWRQLFSRASLPELISGSAVAAFSQANGINAILFYTPAVFTSLQLGQHAALLSATLIGGTLFLGTLVSMVLVDRCFLGGEPTAAQPGGRAGRWQDGRSKRRSRA
jgi:hypothetical protein